MSLAKPELIEKYEDLNASHNFYYEDIFDLRAQTVNSKYMKVRKSGYVISKGKSRIFRRALITFAVALILVFGSMLLLKGVDIESTWVKPLILLPRILALVAVVLGLVRIKSLNEIPPYLTLSEKGIETEKDTITWNSIEGVFLKTSMGGEKICDVIVHTNERIETFDFRDIDEIAEDACIVISKYWKKYQQTVMQHE